MLRQQFTRVFKPALFSIALAVVSSGPVWSCGPYYPDSVFALGDAAVLNAPAMSFSNELAKIQKRYEVKSPKSKDKATQFYETERTVAAGLSDLKASLKLNSGLSELRKKELIQAYSKLRKQFDQSRWSKKNVVFDAVPQDLPGDFKDYLTGAVHYRKKDLKKARSSWQRILNRTSTGPRYRTTWASFMIAKSFKDSDPKKAIAYFQKTRQLARNPLVNPDSLGLANASLGWEAYCQLKQRHYKEALLLYMKHFGTGHYSAQSSISQTCFAALNHDRDIESLAADKLCRAIVTAYVVSHVDQDTRFGLNHKLAIAWLSALEKHQRSTDYADKLAWTFYRLGRIAEAKRWLSRLNKGTPLSYWLSAKLQLRGGQIESALNSLKRALILFPKDECWVGTEDPQLLADWGLKPRTRIHGEIGVLEMSQGHYVEALDHLNKAGYWWDAAYVAESVLSIKELKAYVDKNCPKNKPEDCLRYLLARRLTRSNRLSEARRYMPKDQIVHLDAYRAAMNIVSDFTKSQAERSQGLWAAAKKMRGAGMALIGTELAPDFYVLHGSFTAYSVAKVRAEKAGPRITSARSSELMRVASAKVGVTKRFHYRYKAAELAWLAADLMPDQDPKTAALLNEAGTWLKYRDPKAADRFYKAIVNRCGKTKLGAKARKKRWFP
ncbi:MAG: hypothetical protein P1V97_21250 [Planctomycetota bacterium]|nr:hypothetical protein [Planctomycetota bacterium]